MKLTITIEPDHEMLLGPNDGVGRVLRDIADELDRISLFTLNEFNVTLYDKYGDSVIGEIRQTREDYNPGDITYETQSDGSVLRIEPRRSL
jgi:hypothetical protein